MANLALKNNTGTSTEITMTNNSGSEWKIINDNGTFKLNGKGNLLFSMSDSGIATFENSIVLNGTDTNIRKICTEASGAPIINIAESGQLDIDVFRIAHGTELTRKSAWGYSLRYDGTETGVDNTLTLMADQQNAENQIIGLSINQNGRVGIRRKPDDSYALSVNGFIRAFRDEEVNTGVYVGNSTGEIGLQVNGVRGSENDKVRGLLDVTRNQYMLWYNPTKDRQYLGRTYTGNSFYIRNYFEISNNSYWPSMYFKSSNDEENYMGRIAYGLCGNVNDTAYNINRLYFYHYSYKKDTRERMPNYTNSNGDSVTPGERFRLPKTEADLEVRTDYDILTTKPSSGTYTIDSLRLTNTTDASDSSDNEVALIIGDRAGTHLIADGNEIIAKSDGTTAGLLYLNSGDKGGHVHIGAGGLSIGSTAYTGKDFSLYVNGAIRANNANISAYKDSAAATLVYAQNTLGSIGLLAGSTGWRGLYDRTAERYLLYCKPYTDEDQGEKANMYTTVSYFYTKGIRPIESDKWYLGNETYTWGAVCSKRYRLYNGTDNQMYGYFSIEQIGSSEQHGVTNLILGNGVNSKTATGALGQLFLYGPGSTGGWILPPNDTTLTSNLNFYMPNTGGTFVTHATRGTAVGSANQPVYIAATGRATKVTAVGVAYGGTGATKAEDARANLGAAALAADNTFACHLILNNTKYIKGKKSDGTVLLLLGVSSGNNIIIGDSSAPDQTINMYGKLNLNNALAITEGGTGATTAEGARGNIVYIGKNPITKPEDDTNSNWGTLNNGVAYFNVAGQLNGQPTQYGSLLNMTNGGTVGGQLWITIGGVGYLRGSNSEGFSSWYKLWSSKDTLFTAFSSTADADGETLSITVGGVTKTLTLDAAGVNQGGIITTGSQTIAGTKTFNNTPVIRGTDPAVFFRPDSTARQMSGIQNYIGEDDTKITESYIRLLQYSYTTGTKTALTYYETYKLPPVDESRTKNATYEIFTSKKYDTLDGRYLKLTGGTLSGNILVDKTGSTNNTSISVQNDNGKVTLYTSTNRGLYDNTSGRWIIYTLNSDGTNRIEASLLPGSASTLDLGSTSYPFNKVYANTVTCSRIIATATTDASETKATNVALTLGDTSGTHLILDGNEIIAKNGATAMGTLYLYGSTVEAGGGVFKATKGLAINTLSYGTDEGEITDPVTGQIYLKYV